MAMLKGVWRFENGVRAAHTCIGSSGANCVVVGLVVLVEKTKLVQTYEIRNRIAAKARLVSAEWLLHDGASPTPTTRQR